VTFDAELTRRRRLGSLADLEAGTQTLDVFVAETWLTTYAGPEYLTPKTLAGYVGLYDHHIAPHLGSLPLRSLTPELITRWQADRLAAGADLRHGLRRVTTG
jgi:hypothetical protein